MFEKLKSFAKKAAVSVGATLGLGIAQAHATVPTAVSDALTAAQTDSATVAGLALVIVIGIAAIKYMRRAV